MQIIQNGNQLIFNNILRMEIPDGAVFESETEEEKASLKEIPVIGREDETIQISISPNDDSDYDIMDGIHTFLCEDGMRCNLYYSQIGSLFSVVMMLFRVRLKIRTVDCFFDIPIAASSSEDILLPLETLEKLLESIVLISGDSRLSWKKITDTDIAQQLKDQFGETEYERNLDGTVTEDDTRVVVQNEWAITIPKGYIYSLDPNGWRKLVFMKNDETADFDNHFSANENFSCIYTEGESRQNGAVNMLYPQVLKKTEKLDVFYNVSDAPDEDGLLIIRACVALDNGVYSIQIFFNHVDADSISVQNFINRALSWLQTITPAEEIFDASSAFPIVVTKETSYPHLKYLHDTASNLQRAFGIGVEINATGMENEFISFAEFAQTLRQEDEDEKKKKMADLLEQLEERDKGDPVDELLWDYAKKMSHVFHVPPEQYDDEQDRESNILNGYLRRCYQYNGLRSFAWTAAEYASIHHLRIVDLDENIIIKLAAYVKARGWLNFQDHSHCPCLCGGGDLHIFFVPDQISEVEKKLLLPSEEDYARAEQEKENFPGYSEIFCEVYSLSGLRKDLEFIYPAIRKIWIQLLKNRNFDGPETEILYAWCAVAWASRKPFFMEDGPCGACMEQYPYEESCTDLPEELIPEPVPQQPANFASSGIGGAGIPHLTASVVPEIPKDGTALVSGQRVDCSEIAGKSVEIRFSCSNDGNEYEMDSYTFLLGENGEVYSEEDLIFFNQTFSENHAVQVDLAARYPHVKVQLDRLPDKYHKVAVCFSLYRNSPVSVFGRLQNSTVQLIAEGKEYFHMDLVGLSREGSIVALEFYRFKGTWKMRCIGQGYLNEMEKLCASYGVETI